MPTQLLWTPPDPYRQLGRCRGGMLDPFRTVLKDPGSFLTDLAVHTLITKRTGLVITLGSLGLVSWRTHSALQGQPSFSLKPSLTFLTRPLLWSQRRIGPFACPLCSCVSGKSAQEPLVLPKCMLVGEGYTTWSGLTMGQVPCPGWVIVLCI